MDKTKFLQGVDEPEFTQQEQYFIEILEMALSLFTPEQHKQLIALVNEVY